MISKENEDGLKNEDEFNYKDHLKYEVDKDNLKKEY